MLFNAQGTRGAMNHACLMCGFQRVFSSNRDGPWGLYSKAWDRAGDAEHLMTIEDAEVIHPYGWSADGVLLFDYRRAGSYDVGMLSMDGDGTWEPLLDTEANEQVPAISTDGEWIAYTSDRTGTREIYIQRFPELGGERLISQGGGNYPLWSQDGRELIYRGLNGEVMAVPVTLGADLSIGSASQLFDGSAYFSSPANRHWDVSPDGQRFLMIKDAITPNEPLELVAVQNWFEELKRLVPVD